jgi:pyochelin biosynthesis protein PchG
VSNPERIGRAPDPARRQRTVVCGTGFGRVYLRAVERSSAHELVGIVARGSERSRRCAQRYGVPLFSALDEVPDDIDVACVVIGTAINGGPGAEVALGLLDRGIHVLQEHPIHSRELAECLRTAHRRSVSYLLNTHYLYVDPVRRFIGAARWLREHTTPVFLEMASGVQFGFSLLDVVAETGLPLRPWEVEPETADGAGAPGSMRRLSGVVGGVPFGLTLHYELDGENPDYGGPVGHRITLVTDVGSLTLHDSHGPVLWVPRSSPLAGRHSAVTLLDALEGEDRPSAAFVGPASAPSYRAILGDVWPRAVGRALADVTSAVEQRADPLERGRRYLAICDRWESVTRLLGPVAITSPPATHRADPLPDLCRAAGAFAGL